MTKSEFWAEYSPTERRSFILHTTIAVICLPLYYLLPHHFGLLTAPYLFVLAIYPKNEYLLPVILHCLYGSQQKFFFCLGCFLYVLFHFAALRRYSLHWLYLFYMFLLPYFIWFFYQKLTMPRFVSGIGEVIGGLFAHTVFVVAFWATLVVKKTGRPFFRGMVIWALGLLLVMSFIGGGAMIDIEGTGEHASRTVFSNHIFWAMPFLVSAFTFCQFSRRSDYDVEKLLSLFGCLIIVLDFFHLTKCDVTFTELGICVLSSLITFAAVRWNPRIVLQLTPLPLFFVSAYLVSLSPMFVEKYGGLHAGEGEYNKMSMTSMDSILKKLQRKSVDDRAAMWALTIKYIKSDILPNPIWVKPVPYMEVEAEKESGKTYKAYIAVASHNTMLNLVRFYGFYGGFGLYLLFVWYFCRKTNRVFMSRYSYLPIVAVMAVCISEGVVGGHTGHYVVGVPFGSVLFACLGACWGEGYWRDRAANGCWQSAPPPMFIPNRHQTNRYGRSFK